MRPVVVLGAGGQVGSELCRRGEPFVGLRREQFDLLRVPEQLDVLRQLRPRALVNAAAYTAVDRAEAEADQAYAVNASAVRKLGRAARELGLPVVHFSTDYIFDGDAPGAYREDAEPRPLSVYGASKLVGEKALLEEQPESIILRVSWVFGPGGHNFVKTMLRLGLERDELRVVADQRGCPTSAASIAEVVSRILEAGLAPGVYHYANRPATTWHGFAEAVLARARERGHPLRVTRVVPIPGSEYPTPARRPANSVLDDRKLRGLLPDLPLRWEPYLDQTLSAP